MKNYKSQLFLILIIIFLNSCSSDVSQNSGVYVQEINKNWEFEFDNSWHKAKVPGGIHADLLNNKIIENPFYGENEKKLQWIDT